MKVCLKFLKADERHIEAYLRAFLDKEGKLAIKFLGNTKAGSGERGWLLRHRGPDSQVTPLEC
jgi:hypothetical protein